MFSVNMLAAALCILLLRSRALGEEDLQITTQPTSLEKLNTTWGEIKETATSMQESGVNGQISDFKTAFMGYEKRIKSFIDNVRRGYMVIYTDSSEFLAELRGYMEQLPKNETKSVTKNYRERCYCEGRNWTPCPDRCMDSCYGYGEYNGHSSCCTRQNYDNCTAEKREFQLSDCRCYEGSSTRCDSGMHQCYEEKTEEVLDDKPCLEFTADHSMVEESFLRFSDLLLEPLKILVRDLEFQVSSFKQAVIATDLLSTIISQLCEGQEPTCFPEATELLSQRLQIYKQRKTNITLEMIKTQEQAEVVSKHVHVLKEQIFTQISQSIRKYTCCLKTFNFTVQDNDCNPKPIEDSTTTMRTLEVIPPLPYYTRKNRQCVAPNFLCENKKCIIRLYRCDGHDDCGDMSDEADCEIFNAEDEIENNFK